MFMRLNRIHTNCVSEDRLVLRRILTRNSPISLLWVWLTSDSIGATPTCNTSLKVFELDRLAG